MWFKILLNQILAPEKAYNDLDQEYGKNEFYAYPWIFVLLVYSAIMIPASLSMTPKMKQFIPAFVEKMAEKNGFNEAMTARVMTSMEKSISFQSYFIPVNLILIILLVSLLTWIYLYLFYYNLSFGKIYTVMMLSYAPAIIGSLVSIAYHHATGFKGIAGFGDFQNMTLGVHLFIKGLNPVLKNFLSFVNIFSLWSLFVTITGISVLSKKPFARTAFILFIPYLILNAGLAFLRGNV